jgi:hypothetical protein
MSKKVLKPETRSEPQPDVANVGKFGSRHGPPETPTQTREKNSSKKALLPMADQL